MFNLKKTEIYESVALERLFQLFSILLKLSLAATLASLALFFYGAVAARLGEARLLELMGVNILSFSLFFIFKNLVSFFDECLKKPQRRPLAEALADGRANIASYLNFKSAKYLSLALDFAENRRMSYPNPTILLYFFLDNKNPRILFIFSRLMLDWNGIKSGLKEKIYNERQEEMPQEQFEQIFIEAAGLAARRGKEEIREGDIIASLSKVSPDLREIINSSDIEEDDFENVNQWQEAVYKKIKKDKEFWDYENLLKKGSVGKDWSAGYTPTLDCFSTDWTDIVRRRGFEEIIGHKDKIGQIETILSKKGAGNVLVVGQPGVGRKNAIHGLIRKALLKQSTPEVNGNRFLEMDIISLATNISSFEEMEKILDKCFSEIARAGNVILIINDFHEFLGKEQKAGIIDISGIIGPYLALPTFKTICLTSYEGLHKYIENKPAILANFEKVEIPEMTKEETLAVMESQVFGLEREYGKFIPYNTLKEVANISEKYISNYPFPQKAVLLLEDTAVYSRKTATDVVLPDCADKVLSDKVQVPIGKIKSKEKITLLNLEDILHKRIVAQEEAIKEISSALRRARAGVQTRKGPMGSFLFLGPTGVGKTETAKALAETYFGSENKMVRIDMSEYQRIDDIPRLLGSDGQEGILTTQVRDNPFSLVLLDEIEKAHPNILNVFLQVLDEGYVNDNLGRKVNFSNTIIIATSNAGYEVVIKAILENKEMFEIKKELIDFIMQNNIFRPEFINRFDGVVVFKALGKDDLMQIAQLQLSKINDSLRQKKIKLNITEELKMKIVDLSYDPMFGAREMKRVIQDKVENTIAKALLSDSIPQGSAIQVDPKNFTITIA
jgi:ATP-dependent Clp protease ATP-binding subunit ClpC